MLGLLGDEWTLLITQQALLGATRYGRLRCAAADLARGAHPPVDRDDRRWAAGPRTYQAKPPRDEYVLTTTRARSLWPVLTVDLGVGTPLGARSRRRLRR